MDHHDLFELLPVAAWVFDSETLRFLAVSGAAVQAYGYARDEFLAMTIEAIRPAEDVDALRDHLRGGPEHAARTEWRHRRKDGTVFSVQISSVPVTYHGARGELVIATDITELVRTNEMLRQSERLYQQAQKLESVGRLAGGVAHDFNNLLTAILGFTSLAEREIPQGSHARHSLEEVRKAGERAASLTRQLLLFSRKSVAVDEVVDLGEVVQEMTGMLRRMIGEDMRLHTERRVTGATIRADRGQVEQVLLNLAVNARDAMPSGGELWLNVEVRDGTPAGRGEQVVLTVRDNGCGMTEEVRTHIFEPFFTTKPVGQGTGLGLATVYAIVQHAGGAIDVDSAPGQGTTFRITLPRHVAESPHQEAVRCDAEVRGEGTILLVEDEENVRRLTAAVLRQSGYQVHAVASGEEALQIAANRANRLDLVLSDLVMPGPNGRETVEAILEVRPGLPHLYMSGYTDDAIVSRGIRTGDSPFIQKPFVPAALLSKVRQVITGAARTHSGDVHTSR